jgi:hypothetical protein
VEENILTMQTYTEALLDASKEVGLELNQDKTKYSENFFLLDGEAAAARSAARAP